MKNAKTSSAHDYTYEKLGRKMRHLTLLLTFLVLFLDIPFLRADTNTGSERANRKKDTSVTMSARIASYPIVDTGQDRCFDANSVINCPESEQSFFGQDAHFVDNRPTYRDNGDGTIGDLVTGLMWIKERGPKLTWDSARVGASACRTGGYEDWRMPTIKELYSLIDFTGYVGSSEANSVPFLDTGYFDFKYGDLSAGERVIDCQDWSATEYVGTTMNGDATVFGVNFADGRIKGYAKFKPGTGATIGNILYVRYVRDNPEYGLNEFSDNGNGTITDLATNLMWSKTDSGQGLNWEQALQWVRSMNESKYVGYDDWRLPNAKELHSIVDYSRAPDATFSGKTGPAIDPVFQISKIDEDEYPFFWTGTTHFDGPFDNMYAQAVYIAFGRALGWMEMPPNSGNLQLVNVHGAGAQRSDPKDGDPADFPFGRGPQGDVIRIYNYVRCVRDYDLSQSYDLNGDGKLDTQDYMLLAGSLAEHRAAASFQKLLGDIDMDGSLSILDLMLLQEIILVDE